MDFKCLRDWKKKKNHSESNKMIKKRSQTLNSLTHSQIIQSCDQAKCALPHFLNIETIL